MKLSIGVGGYSKEDISGSVQFVQAADRIALLEQVVDIVRALV